MAREGVIRGWMGPVSKWDREQEWCEEIPAPAGRICLRDYRGLLDIARLDLEEVLGELAELPPGGLRRARLELRAASARRWVESFEQKVASMSRRARR